MGHLINPISFRLGYSRNWGFSGALMESKSQYFYLNGNYWNILLFFKRIFSLQIFEKMGIIFSHLKFLSHYKNDLVIIYLYDGPFESEAFIFQKYLNRFKKTKIILKKIKRNFKKFLYKAFFLFYYLNTIDFLLNNLNMLLFSLLKFKIYKFSYKILFIKSNLKCLDNIYLFKSVVSNHIYSLKKKILDNLFSQKLNNIFFLTIEYDFFLYSFFAFYKQQTVLKYIFLKFFNFLISYTNKVKKIIFAYNKFDILSFINVYNFVFRKKQNYLCLLNFKNNIYYKNIFGEFLLNINSFENLIFSKFDFQLNKFLKKFVLKTIDIVLIQRINFYKFCSKIIFSLGKKLKRKFIFLNFFSKILIFIVNNFFFFLRNIIFAFKPFFFNTLSKNFSIYFKNLSKIQITASVITKFIAVRLKQKFSLKEILKPILKDLSTNPSLKGFRLSCCGRFTKKEIATYKWERRGKISLNTIEAKIDYSFDFVILKYSVCGIKIWLHRNPNYKLFFRKWFENYKNYLDKKRKNLKNIKKIRSKKRKIQKKYINNQKYKSKFFRMYKKYNNLIIKKNLKPFIKNIKYI